MLLSTYTYIPVDVSIKKLQIEGDEISWETATYTKEITQRYQALIN